MYRSRRSIMFRLSALQEGKCKDDGGSKLPWNISQYLLDYTVQLPWRQPSSSEIMYLFTHGRSMLHVRFQVLTAASMMFRIGFWDVLIIPDDGGSTHLWNVGRQLFYMAVHPRRQFWTRWFFIHRLRQHKEASSAPTSKLI
jgi:hypothetical protein